MKRDYDTSGFPELDVSYADVLSRPLFYPENHFAEDMAILMRRKTFTKKEIELLRKMGFKVNVNARKIQIPAHLK